MKLEQAIEYLRNQSTPSSEKISLWKKWLWESFATIDNTLFGNLFAQLQLYDDRIPCCEGLSGSDEERNIFHHYLLMSEAEYKYGAGADEHVKAQNELLTLIIGSLVKLKENPLVATLDFNGPNTIVSDEEPKSPRMKLQ